MLYNQLYYLAKMSNYSLNIPELQSKGLLIDYRDRYAGGFGWRGDRPLNEVRFVAIHHTVSTPTGKADDDVARIAREHITNRGWGGIGYNIVVTSEEQDGFAKVAYVGDVGSIRAHTPNEKGSFGLPARFGNYYIMGISVVGNFTNTQPTDAQLRSLHRVCYNLIFDDSRFNELVDWNSLKNHKDFDFTSCAGNFDSYKNKIITPPTMTTETAFQKELREAKTWQNLMKRKYNIELMSKVDNSTLTREHLLVILHRYTSYLQRSTAV
jgi:hypothetical protein